MVGAMIGAALTRTIAPLAPCCWRWCSSRWRSPGWRGRDRRPREA